MNGRQEKRLRFDLALIHHPVINRRGEVIGSAVTNLDLHDLSRAGRTYGIDTYWVVTPYEDQHCIVQELLDHWLRGHGATANPDRAEALGLVRLAIDLDEVLAGMTEKWGLRPRIVATSARAEGPSALSFTELGRALDQGEPTLLLLGTASGLAPEVLARADGLLPPLRGRTGYNHLSVRAAAAIMLDRLLAVTD